jgi:uncharacterized phage protein (TIGR02216 family)
MHVGLCLLRLPPITFWAMTPIEFHAMAGGLSLRVASLDRNGLRALMEQFPDAGLHLPLDGGGRSEAAGG